MRFPLKRSQSLKYNRFLPRCGIEGIDSGVNSELGNGARQHSGGVQMGEGGSGGGIGQIVSGHVDGLSKFKENRNQNKMLETKGSSLPYLDRGNGTLLGGGDSLLHGTHVSGQSGLVTDSGGDTTKQGRHLGTGLGESEKVTNEMLLDLGAVLI